MLDKVVSGGQTGVDRGALDAALDVGFSCGGFCPRGRRAEDGPIDARYPLEEHASPSYPARTRANVEGSDATLVLTRGPVTGGSALTVDAAREHGRALLIIDLERESEAGAASAIASWLARERVRVLNVAGPRESGAPGISAASCRVMTQVLLAARSTTE